MKKSIVMMASVLFASTLFAQNRIDSSSKTELNSITVKALRASDNAPFTKTEITKAQLERNNTGVDLPILLNQTANAVTTSDAGTGVGYTGIRLRGSDISRINVTINGVPVNDAEGQSVYFVNFADVASSVQNIQIQRGVGSSTNGAGAFGASINMNTLDIPENKYANFNIDASSNATWRQTLRASSGLLKNKYFVSGRLSRITSDGYIQRSASRLHSGQFTAGYYVSKNTSIIFNYMGGAEKTGQAWNGLSAEKLLTDRTYNELGLKTDGTFYNNQTDNYAQHYLQLLINHRINKIWKINATPYYTRGLGYYQEYRVQDYLPNYNITPKLVDTTLISTSDIERQLWLNNHLLGLNASAIASYGTSTITIGLAANRYFGQHYGIVTNVVSFVNPATKWYDLSAQKTDLSTFMKAEWQTNSTLRYYVDVQFRRVDYTINGFRKNPTLNKDNVYNFVNPKIGLQYKINEAQKMYASFGIANKEPNRGDLEAGINNEPDAETLQNIEIGYNRKQKNNVLQANIYYMRYANQLVLTGKINDVGEYVRENVAQSYRAGIEIEMTNALLKNKILIQTNLAISTNKIKNSIEYIDDYTNGIQVQVPHQNTDISFSPNMVAGATLSYLPIKNLQIDAINKYVGKQYLDNTSNESRIIASFFTTDIMSTYSFTIAKRKIGARFGVYNIGNHLYSNNGYTFSYIAGGAQTTSNYYYPQAGTRFTGGLSIGL
jgi:iron complex outermembrane recepter protein